MRVNAQESLLNVIDMLMIHAASRAQIPFWNKYF